MLQKYFRNRTTATISIICGLVLSLFLANFGISALIYVLKLTGVDFGHLNGNIFSSVYALLMYAFAIYLFMLWSKFMSYGLTKSDIGLRRLPRWSDIGVALLAFISYMILANGFISVVHAIFPNINLNETQNIGFSNLSSSLEYYLAFITLVILAPLAEELLFRGYVLGSLRKYFRPWSSALIVSIIFALAHGSISVGLDVFVLSLVLSALKFSTGSLWAGILVHMLKNLIAFYLLFINPVFLSTLGG